MREAERELSRAREDLENILRQLREEEIERSLASLESRFRRMLEAQLKIQEETQRINGLASDPAVSGLEIESGKLASRQRELVNECGRALLVLEDDGSSIATIETVRQLKIDLVGVADRLAAFQTGELTQQIQSDAIETLGFLVSAFEKAQEDAEAQKAAGENGGNAAPGQEALVSQLAELKLVRGLQSRILARHRLYASQLPRADDPVGYHEDPEMRQALQDLSVRQAALLQVTRDIVAEQQRRQAPGGGN
jgi:hypothetical protein